MLGTNNALPQILKAPAVVLGYLNPNYLRAIALPCVGMVDGGVQDDLPLVILDWRSQVATLLLHMRCIDQWQATIHAERP